MSPPMRLPLPHYIEKEKVMMKEYARVKMFVMLQRVEQMKWSARKKREKNIWESFFFVRENGAMSCLSLKWRSITLNRHDDHIIMECCKRNAFLSLVEKCQWPRVDTFTQFNVSRRVSIKRCWHLIPFHSQCDIVKQLIMFFCCVWTPSRKYHN